jgi:hypothetical protein
VCLTGQELLDKLRTMELVPGQISLTYKSPWDEQIILNRDVVGVIYRPTNYEQYIGNATLLLNAIKKKGSAKNTTLKNSMPRWWAEDQSTYNLIPLDRIPVFNKRLVDHHPRA